MQHQVAKIHICLNKIFASNFWINKKWYIVMIFEITICSNPKIYHHVEHDFWKYSEFIVPWKTVCGINLLGRKQVYWISVLSIKACFMENQLPSHSFSFSLSRFHYSLFVINTNFTLNRNHEIKWWHNMFTYFYNFQGKK